MTLFSYWTPLRLLALVLLTACAGACSDSTGIAPAPTVDSVEGTYAAGKLETREAEETTDWLAEGASIRLQLRGDGTTAGRLFIPGAGEEGRDFHADLAGEWSIVGQEVHLNHDADTFLRDVPLRVREERLEGSAEFSGLLVQVVLVREGV